MDEQKEMSSSLPPGIGQALSKLMADPELVKRIRETVGNVGAAETSSADAPSTDAAVSPELAGKLPGVMETLSPLLLGKKQANDSEDRRTALLLAMKPFLSPARCRAVDSILSLSHISDLLGGQK